MCGLLALQDVRGDLDMGSESDTYGPGLTDARATQDAHCRPEARKLVLRFLFGSDKEAIHG